MANAYRIVRIEPTCRITRTELMRNGEGTASPLPVGGSRMRSEANHVVRIEPSYRIVRTEVGSCIKEGGSPSAASKVHHLPNIRDDNHEARLLQEMVDNAPDALLLVSSDGHIDFANGSCKKLLGYRPEELVGQSIDVLVPADARNAHKQHRVSFKDNFMQRPMGRISKLTAVRKDGALIPVDIAISRIRAATTHPMFVVAVRDATEQQAHLRGLEALATTDPLTGVLNRRSFSTAGLREFERFHRLGSPLSLMMIDIDHFKAINDHYGHDSGDRALVDLTSICLSKLRKTDVMARLGGEEFAILVPGSKSEVALTLAERLREDVGNIRTRTPGGNVSFTVSIGLTEARPGDTSITDAMGRADQALYAAKRNGRNMVVMDEERHINP